MILTILVHLLWQIAKHKLQGTNARDFVVFSLRQTPLYVGQINPRWNEHRIFPPRQWQLFKLPVRHTPSLSANWRVHTKRLSEDSRSWTNRFRERTKLVMGRSLLVVFLSIVLPLVLAAPHRALPRLGFRENRLPLMYVPIQRVQDAGPAEIHEQGELYINWIWPT